LQLHQTGRSLQAHDRRQASSGSANDRAIQVDLDANLQLARRRSRPLQLHIYLGCGQHFIAMAIPTRERRALDALDQIRGSR
jgi:hypothetical protein